MEPGDIRGYKAWRLPEALTIFPEVVRIEKYPECPFISELTNRRVPSEQVDDQAKINHVKNSELLINADILGGNKCGAGKSPRRGASKRSAGGV